MFNGFLKRIKKAPDEEKPLKPVYKLDKDSGMYTISCPYCGHDLLEVYYRRIDDVKIGSCKYCGKSLS